MMKLYKLLLTGCVLCLFFAPKAKAQEVVWDVSYDFFFDNREYKSTVNWPQTLFGMRLAPEIGIRWEKQHSLMAGISLLADFGAKPFRTENELFAYYRYDSKRFNAAAGIVPRHKLIGEYPTAFFNDSIRHYDPNLSGLLLQYRGSKGFVEFAADWNSMISDTRREKFVLFSSGRLNLARGLFYAGYHFSMYHHAGTHLEDGVVDNVLIHPHIGTELSGITPFDRLSLQVGWMQTFQNDRKYVGEYVTPGGVQIELKMEKWKFGVFNTLYLGKSLMPYFVAPPELDYGDGLYWGDPFYRTRHGIYNRLEVYWQPVDNQKMNLRVSTVHHYDGARWDWQQKISFSIYLGQRRLLKERK